MEAKRLVANEVSTNLADLLDQEAAAVTSPQRVARHPAVGAGFLGAGAFGSTERDTFGSRAAAG